MFVTGKRSYDELMAELRSLRCRVDEVLGRGESPPLTKAEFYVAIDAEADTSEYKVDRVAVGRVLKVSFGKLKRMPHRERAAMIQELLR